MGIIKAEQSTSHAPRTVRPAVFHYHDVARRAERLLADVQQRAAGILDEARQQAELLRRQAQQQAERDAQQEAERRVRAELEARWQTLAAALDQAIQQLDQQRHAWLEQWEQAAVRLATAIAERIVRRELQRDPEISLHWVREALELTHRSVHAQLRLHPADYETLGPRAEQLARQLGRLGRTEVVADPQIQAGGCRIDTHAGSIDQQLDVQLARLEHELLG